MEYVLAVVALAAFGYFVYTRVQKSKNKTSGGSGGGGGGTQPPTRQK